MELCIVLFCFFFFCFFDCFFVFVCLFVCLFVFFFFAFLIVFLFLFVCLFVCFFFLYVCLFVFLFVCLFVFLFDLTYELLNCQITKLALLWLGSDLNRVNLGYLYDFSKFGCFRDYSNCSFVCLRLPLLNRML
jgi:hypothetical protein